MVYSKSDGSGGGFSWEKQLRFLQEEHADNLEEIVLTKLEVLSRRSPEKAEHFQSLLKKLNEKIIGGMKSNPDFGFDDAQEITTAFVDENQLQYLLDEEHLLEPVKHWCYSCEDFTPHLPMENDQHYCTICHSQRQSAISSYSNTALKKFADLVSYLSES